MPKTEEVGDKMFRIKIPHLVQYLNLLHRWNVATNGEYATRMNINRLVFLVEHCLN
jgi:hypothetical protein